MEALDLAVKAAGTVAALANALDVPSSLPSMWRSRRRVPAEHCPAIEAATRRIAAERGDTSLIVTCEQLRPDVQWRVLRETNADLRQTIDVAAPVEATTADAS